MVYAISLSSEELDDIDWQLQLDQFMSKTMGFSLRPRDLSPQVALVFARARSSAGTAHPAYHLRWLGVVKHPKGRKVGTRDALIKVEPLWRSPAPVELAAVTASLSRMDAEELTAMLFNEVVVLPDELGERLVAALRELGPRFAELLDRLSSVADQVPFDSSRIEDRSWQEQYDSARLALSIAEFPLAPLSAWRRPRSPHDTYLAGLIPEPTEQSLIEHDAAHSVTEPRFLQPWDRPDFRCDIHVFEHQGRRIEVANVNATPVEARLGSDLIYYHEATHSFVLVQYKRLPSVQRWIYVDDRLRGQLDRLEAVARLSRPAYAPHDWRLGSDPCFVKLAYWPEDGRGDPGGPAAGMYLPLSYVHLLLQDDCTLGPGGGRRLGYDYADRHLINSQFIELVKHGLAGTVGTTREDLLALGEERAAEGYSVTIAAELGDGRHPGEAVRERQRRANSRGANKRQARKSPPVTPPTATEPRQPVTGEQLSLGLDDLFAD
ncbi:hypothetical protein OHA91_10420 [Streptomyces erythrochromogenes]|uniref:Uncharacterized protein n=2 Tax=Streptomyces erythrochromogenes TaxID=285574 RepID=A0ABZ1Q865_9ACTN|nr:hypothetical protein [Streptomyces erythrochromogenes]